MTKEKTYSFEKPRKNLKFRLIRVYEWLRTFFAEDTEHEEDKETFKSRLAIPDFADLNQRERFILNGFIRNNLYNIYWYAKRIRKEQRKLNRYYGYTLLLLLGVPILIFISTSGLKSDSDLVNQLLMEQELSSMITVLVTLLLALHKFISGWMDQRKIVVEFSTASIELKKVYYQIENLHSVNKADGLINFEGRTEDQTLSDAFLASLSDGIVLSRRIVDAETKNYYTLRAQPSFNISHIWDSSSASAKKALNLFKAKSFDPDATEAKIQTLTEKADSAQLQIETKSEQLAKMALLIKQKRKTAEKVSIRLDELEIIRDDREDNELTDNETTLYEKLQVQFDELDDAADALEEEYERVGLEVKLLENRLVEIQGVL